MSSSATSKAWTANSSGTVVPAFKCRLICRANSVYDWKLRTFLIASPMDSLTTPYSATKRFATARKTKSLLGKIKLITRRKLTRHKTYRSCVTAGEFMFRYNINCTSLFAMRIKKSPGNDKITALCEINIPPRRYFKRYKQQKQTLKNC